MSRESHLRQQLGFVNGGHRVHDLLGNLLDLFLRLIHCVFPWRSLRLRGDFLSSNWLIVFAHETSV